MSDTAAKQHRRDIPTRYDQALALPHCELGIGAVIQAPDSPELIAGVQVRPCSLWPDDRGYFLEVLRSGQGLAKDFPAATTQVSASVCYPRTIKAFHYHEEQSDAWLVAAGMLQVALVDLRSASPTFGARNTFYIGELRPWQLLIPPGVGHGCKTLGTKPSTLIYVTNRFYNPQDEGRIPYNDPDIAYNWDLQHK